MKVVSPGKDIVALLRDATLFVLAMLLLVFPAQFNTILVDAGFEEGSVVGFKWKSKLIDSNQALEEARSTIASLQTRNDELLKALQYAKAKSDDPELMKRVTALQEENRKLQDQTQRVQTVVADTIESNAPLVQKAISAAEQRAAPATLGKSAYTVGLQTLGVDDSERVAINQKLQADGYGLDPLTYSYPAGQRPDWFAPQSTVFYYANAAGRWRNNWLGSCGQRPVSSSRCSVAPGSVSIRRNGTSRSSFITRSGRRAAKEDRHAVAKGRAEHHR